MSGREADGADLSVPDDLNIPDDDILEIVDDEDDAEELAAPREKEEVVDEEDADQLADYEARIAEETDRIRHEAALAVHRATKERSETQAQAAGVIIQSIDDRIARATDALVRAKEDADHSAEVRAQEALTALKGQREKAIEARNVALQHAARKPPEMQRAERPPPKIAQRWVQNNSDWTMSDDHRPEQAFLLEISKQYARQHDPNSRAYYDAVTQRMRAQFPDLQIRDLEGKVQQRGPAPRPVQRRQSPVTGGSGAVQQRRSGNDEARFTQADLVLFRNLGIDVNDKAQAQALKQARADRIRKGDR